MSVTTSNPKKTVFSKIEQTKTNLVNGLPKFVAFFFFISVFFSFLMEQNFDQLNRQALEQTPQILAISEFSEPEKISLELKEIELPKEQKEKQLLDKKTELFRQWANRINQFSLEIGSPLRDQYGLVFVEIGVKYNIHPYALVAIAFADSTLGKNLTTPFNLGNVGNTDSCPNCVSFKSWEEGIEAIARALTGRLLNKATKLCHLSPGGWQHCPEGRTINQGRYYASSPTNWNRNAIWAESWLHGTSWTTDHTFVLSDYLPKE
jgi:hypothetical protein